MRDGLEAIMTVTHGFVNQSERLPILRVADWLLRAKEAITKFLTIKLNETFPAQVTMREQVTKSSLLGKELWLAGTDQQVSHI